MTSLALKAKTAFSLGIGNLFRVLCYRAGLKTGLLPAYRQKAVLPQGPFFTPVSTNQAISYQNDAWGDKALYFGWFGVPLGDSPPDWHLNPFTRKQVPNPDRPWWKISDFNSSAGDIKTIWEASRFDWVMHYAARASSGESRFLKRLNAWIGDWCRNNPAYLGPNWKCGQEAAIRVMHLAMGALLLNQHQNPAPALTVLIRAHLKRISPTLSYALAQDNNHGTSEAAALFIGGTWLSREVGDINSKKWAKKGRYWLENRISRLVAPDGSFSQYSTNYHRVMLDTLSMVEFWRGSLELPEFSIGYKNRCRAATMWLASIVDPQSGNAPNLGANDGAWLLPIKDNCRDFRPSVCLAQALYNDTSNEISTAQSQTVRPAWIIDPPADTSQPETTSSQNFPNGGYAVLRGKSSWGLVRYANFRFRPSHADILHFDLWYRGINILRDGGTFSYNADSEWNDYFSGTASHNTIQFDNRDQMPRIGRFLFGAWIRMDECSDIQESGDVVSWTGAYTDRHKARHRRTVSAKADSWRIRDEISGFKKKAVLRWRLHPGDWNLSGNCCRSRLAQITIHSGTPVRRIELTAGWESLFYHQKTELPVLEFETEPGKRTIETEIKLTG